jgi:hypothetical protein
MMRRLKQVTNAVVPSSEFDGSLPDRRPQCHVVSNSLRAQTENELSFSKVEKYFHGNLTTQSLTRMCLSPKLKLTYIKHI